MAAHRYWRIVMLTAASAAYSFAEIEFRTTAGTSLAFSGGTASARDVWTGGAPASNATDGNLATLYSSNDKTDPQWWAYDFGATSSNWRDVVQIAITARNDSQYGQTPSTFRPEWSDDGMFWTPMVVITAATWTASSQVQALTVTAPPAPALDGSNTGTSSATTTVAATLSTTGTNRIVCALINIEQSAGNCWITGVTGGGLTWAKRNQVTTLPDNSNANANSVELWWALAPTALSSTTITATANATFDDAAMLVFGVANCNTVNPWDSHASLAAKQLNMTGTLYTMPFTNISTAQYNDFLIFGWGANNSQTAGTVPTGFTSIGFTLNAGGSRYAAVAGAYQVVSAQQTNQTFQWGSGVATGGGGALFDALTGDTGGVTAAPRPNYEVVTHRLASVTNTVSFTMAGISTNDTLVIISYCEQSGGGPAITGISGGGVTWTQRSRSHSSSRGSLEVWSAKVTGTLAPSTITVSYAANFDNLSLEALAFFGANFVNSWDSNSSLPAILSNTASSSSWTPSLTTSTTQAHDLVLAIAASSADNSTNPASVPTGFARLNWLEATGGSLWAYLSIGVQPRVTPQSSAAITWGTGLSDQTSPNAGGEYIVDALTADSAVVHTTWSPTDLSAGVVLTGGNLTATGANPQTVRAAHGQRAGKYYFEITINGGINTSSWVAIGTGATPLGIQAGTPLNQMNFDGGIYVNNSYQNVSLGTRSSGNVIGIAVDIDNKLSWWRVAPSGNWNNNAGYIPGGAGGINFAPASGFLYFPMAFFATAANYVANFGDTAFSGTVPTGFTSGWPTSSFPNAAVITQIGVEEWYTTNPPATVTQVGTEVWYAPASQFQAAQVLIEDWAAPNPQLQIAQVVVEHWATIRQDATGIPAGVAATGAAGAVTVFFPPPPPGPSPTPAMALSASRAGTRSVVLNVDNLVRTTMVSDVGTVIEGHTFVAPTGRAYHLTAGRAGVASAVVTLSTNQAFHLSLPAVVAEASLPTLPTLGSMNGVFASGVAGTITTGLATPAMGILTGVAATGVPGVLTVFAVPPTLASVTGVAAIGAVGVFSPLAIGPQPLHGVAATGFAGVLLAFPGPVVFPAGVYATGAPGTIFALAGGIVEKFIFFMAGPW